MHGYFRGSPGEIEFELKTPLHSGSETFQAEAELAIRDSDIKLATDRFNVLAPLKTKQFLSKQDVEQCSLALGLSASQVRRLFAQLDMKKGPKSLILKRRLLLELPMGILILSKTFQFLLAVKTTKI
ncbi:hypothetical protein [Pseudomonas anguilliseptica]|uniref:hypothetical protein n=1 Tax=Pseudomonas anguilliseptica TaxID=53406 RepID=UPI000B88427D|nr:hypothetical protein [Pseudomonas anguilliseptica]